MLNVEPDVVSTSFGYSEFILPDAGGISRDFDSDGVEIVRFQLAHIEYHSSAGAAAADNLDSAAGPLPYATDEAEAGVVKRPAAATTSEARATIETNRRHLDDNDDDVAVGNEKNADVTANGDVVATVPQTAAANCGVRPPSIQSAKSSEDSESNEMQSLMTNEIRSTSC